MHFEDEPRENENIIISKPKFAKGKHCPHCGDLISDNRTFCYICEEEMIRDYGYKGEKK